MLANVSAPPTPPPLPPPPPLRLHFFVATLNTTQRAAYIAANRRLLPSLQPVRAVNGFDKRQTITALLASRLKYHIHTYCSFSRFGTYGSLANYLTKYFLLVRQVRERLPYMAMIEDDLRLHRGFERFVTHAARVHLAGGRRGQRNPPPPEMLVLGPWGEGYVSSLASARRIVSRLQRQGVNMNVDVMLNNGHAGRALRLAGTPWSHIVPPNSGDCLRTKHIGWGELPREALALPPPCARASQCLEWAEARRRRYCVVGGSRGAAEVPGRR